MVALVGLLACGPDPASSPATSSASASLSSSSSVSAASARSSASSAPSAMPSSEPVASAAPPAVSASWPKRDAPQPSEEAWSKAEPINTAPADKQPAGCSLVHVGEWFRARCKDQIFLEPDGADNGKQGVDWIAKPASSIDLVVRARPGAITAFGFSLPHVHLRIAWPSNASAPTVAQLDTIESTDIERALPPMAVAAIPDMPPDDAAPRPSPADWLGGVEVDTADKAARANECSLRLYGRWLRRLCRSSVFFEDQSSFGEKNKDWFYVPNYDLTLLVVRLHEGMSIRTSFDAKSWAQMNIVWPRGAPKPTTLDVRRAER